MPLIRIYCWRSQSAESGRNDLVPHIPAVTRGRFYLQSSWMIFVCAQEGKLQQQMTPVRTECPVSQCERTEPCVFAVDFTMLIGHSSLLAYSVYEISSTEERAILGSEFPVMSQHCGCGNFMQERSFCSFLIVHRFLLMRSLFIWGETITG